MTEVAIYLMGKKYQIKCAEAEVESVQKTAAFLEEKMATLRTHGKMLSADQITVLTALDIAHEFLQLEEKAQAIQQKLDYALSSHVSE